MAVPAITPASLSVGQVICRRRDVRFVEPDDRFLLYKNDFSTSNNPWDQTVAVATQCTNTFGQNKWRYLGNGGVANITKVLATCRLPCAQFTNRIYVQSQNTPAGTYADVRIGFAITPSATSDTVQDWMFATYRRTNANQFGYLELMYTHSGGTEVFSGGNMATWQAAALNYPCWLGLGINHNSMVMTVEEPNGLSRILRNYEIPTNRWNLETLAHVGRLKPLIELRSDQALDVTISDWEVRANGTLGDREHYPATYENGEPIRTTDNMMFITADATFATTQTAVGGPLVDSAYMRNQSTTRLYNPETGRMGRATAKYAIVSTNGLRVFAAQQGKVVYDRGTRKFHVYFSNWNDVDISGRTRIIHWETYENPLYGYHIIPYSGNVAGGWEYIDLQSFGSPLSLYNYYDSDVIKYNGRWYLCGTVNTTGLAARVPFCVSGNAPNSFNTLEFMGNEGVATPWEGTGFWMLGGSLYVGSSTGSNVTHIFDLDGVDKTSFTLNGGSGRGYGHQARVIPYVRRGETQYQAITFSDYSTGEDYKADLTAVTQTLAFGSTVVNNLGTFPGEEFESKPMVGAGKKLLLPCLTYGRQ